MIQKNQFIYLTIVLLMELFFNSHNLGLLMVPVQNKQEFSISSAGGEFKIPNDGESDVDDTDVNDE